ncbi:TetR family transcriptional regulator [Devosia limi DSM 17137]|uniref:TetR family transcriptional regulator n=1 Tax=Devosia limi DSM 17137 TaxID=1121477 RepID=A0A0F5LEE3_9HYPH|nr:TetR/AcrR family transcriptional regulator [Devosia limi]KKB80554.1 TetR family transcriptional regulator [Devosia limi DSM 17137]SHF23007.1 transcriptional regulator, TetR family [Devosia limi DSM 17137]
MAEDIAGRGDPVKSLQLMWGRMEAPRRGPKAKASVAELVAAAVSIADAEGLDAVSTRRVADAVGISPMSFYTHIPGKAELLDLMLDAVTGAGLTEIPEFEPEHWRRNLAFIAHEHRAFYMRHPWVLHLATHRPVLGPNTMMAAEIALRALEGLGLTDLEMDHAFTLITSYVHGAVRDAAREKMVKELTGMTDNEWWHRVAPFLETVDFSPYPVLSRVGAVAGETYGAHDPIGAFAFGLERVLDGLAVFIESKAAQKG